MDKKQHPFDFSSIKNSPSIQLNEAVIQYVERHFFRSLITPLPVRQIAAQLQLEEWPLQCHIFDEGQKFEKYVFIVQGTINLYKKTNPDTQSAVKSNICMEIVQSKSAPTIVGQTFFNNHINRTFTAITDDTVVCRGFTLDKKIFQKYSSNLVKEYKILKNYLCQYLGISTDRLYKVDLYEHIKFKTAYYGHEVNVDDEVCIIYEGECLMSYCKEKQQIKEVKQNQNRRSQWQMGTERTQRVSLPYKIDRNAHSMRKYLPLLNMCENECFGMEKLPKIETKESCHIDNSMVKFRYVVNSQKVIFLSIKHTSLSIFPVELKNKLSQVLESYQAKVADHINLRQKSNSLLSSRVENNKITSRSLSPKGLSVSQHQKDLEEDLKSKMGHSAVPKVKFTQISLQKSGESQNKDTKSFRLPKLPNLKKIQKAEMNKRNNLTEILSQNSQNCPVVKKVDLIEMRKIYCLGFDSKNKCEKKSIVEQGLKDQIKEPKGYFSFGANKAILKQNSRRQQSLSRSNSKQSRKEWASYVKLPNLSRKRSTHFVASKHLRA